MTKQRRSFTPEFKREAACLVLDQGYSHIEAARSLGVVESALRRWVKQLQEERVGVTPKSKALSEELRVFAEEGQPILVRVKRCPDLRQRLFRRQLVDTKMIQLIEIFDSGRPKHALNGVITRRQHGVEQPDERAHPSYAANQDFLFPQRAEELDEVATEVGGHLARRFRRSQSRIKVEACHLFFVNWLAE